MHVCVCQRSCKWAADFKNLATCLRRPSNADCWPLFQWSNEQDFRAEPRGVCVTVCVCLWLFVCVCTSPTQTFSTIMSPALFHSAVLLIQLFFSFFFLLSSSFNILLSSCFSLKSCTSSSLAFYNHSCFSLSVFSFHSSALCVYCRCGVIFLAKSEELLGGSHSWFYCLFWFTCLIISSHVAHGGYFPRTTAP